VTDIEKLLADKAAADAALAGHEERLLAELAAAKETYRDDPSDDNGEAKRAAAERLRAYRQVTRADRDGVGVIADTMED
jgi:hypothetical protein